MVMICDSRQDQPLKEGKIIKRSSQLNQMKQSAENKESRWKQLDNELH